MPGILYILQTRNLRFYIGSTNNLKRRLTEHSQGKTKYTKNLLPFKLRFWQQYSTLKQARQVEAKLKKFKRRDIIERIVRDGVIKLTIKRGVA